MKLLKKLAVIALFLGAKLGAMNEQELAAYRHECALQEAAQKAHEALRELSDYNDQIGTTLYLAKNWERAANAGNDQEYAKKEAKRLFELIEEMQAKRAQKSLNLRNDQLKNNIFLKEPNRSVSISQGQGWPRLDYNSKEMREDIERECSKKIEPIEPISRTEKMD